MKIAAFILVAVFLTLGTPRPVEAQEDPQAPYPCANGAPLDLSHHDAFCGNIWFKPDGALQDPRVARMMHLSDDVEEWSGWLHGGFPQNPARSIAIIVAIEDYKNEKFNVNKGDAEQLVKFFRDDQGFDEIVLITGEQATIDNIRYFLRTYSLARTNAYQGRIRFVFAFSGHGVPLTFYKHEDDLDTPTPSVGLAMWAARSSKDLQNIYGLAELRGLFADLAKNSYQFLALINACYGGAVFTLGWQGMSLNPNGPGAWMITAGRADEETSGSDDGVGSAFFRTITQGIESGDADRPALEATEKGGAVDLTPAQRAAAGLVRLRYLDEYLADHLNKSLDPEDREGDPFGHHWIGSVGPEDIAPYGGFFFLQERSSPAVLNTKSYDPQQQPEDVQFGPSLNQIKVDVAPPTPIPVDDPLETLRASKQYVRGFDVTNHAGQINWDAVATANFDFVYIKATEGATFVDKSFAGNWDGAKSIRLARGAYHYFSFCADPNQQLRNIFNVVKTEKNDLPIVLDVELFDSQATDSGPPGQQAEGRCAFGQPADQVREKLLDMLAKLHDHYGTKPILYATEYVLKHILQPSDRSKYRLWRYRPIKQGPPTGEWSIWQYSWNERVPGIRDAVNVDVLREAKQS